MSFSRRQIFKSVLGVVALGGFTLSQKTSAWNRLRQAYRVTHWHHPALTNRVVMVSPGFYDRLQSELTARSSFRSAKPAAATFLMFKDCRVIVSPHLRGDDMAFGGRA